MSVTVWSVEFHHANAVRMSLIEPWIEGVEEVEAKQIVQEIVYSDNHGIYGLNVFGSWLQRSN